MPDCNDYNVDLLALRTILTKIKKMQKYKRLMTLIYSNALKDCNRPYEYEFFADEENQYDENGYELSSFEINIINMLYDGVLKIFTEDNSIKNIKEHKDFEIQ
jgi:hypothetical protein